MFLKKMYLIIIASVLVLLIGICIFLFVYFHKNANELKDSYDQQIAQLEEELLSYGPMTEVWTVSKQTLPGHEVSKENLKPLKILKKNVGKTYITDIKKIIGKYYKVSILPGTPLTEDLLMSEEIDDTMRQYEVVSTTIPVGLQVGDYIDYRFLLPKGEDYIAIPHKRVEGLYGKVVTLYMTEEEIHIYQSMLVDYFLNEGSQIYMTKYLEPSIQETAKQYYPISNNILQLLSRDPNITEDIENLVTRSSKDRKSLEKEFNSITEEIISKILGGRSAVIGQMDSANGLLIQRAEIERQQNKVNGQDSNDALVIQNDSTDSIQDELEQNESANSDNPDVSEQTSPEEENSQSNKDNSTGTKPKKSSIDSNKQNDLKKNDNKPDGNNKNSGKNLMDGVVE